MAEHIEREAAIKRFSFATMDMFGAEPIIRASDVVAALRSLPAADVVERPRWISVEERMPEKAGDYLVYIGEYKLVCSSIFMKDFLTEEGRKAHPNGKWYDGGVTHWMELPEPPKE